MWRSILRKSREPLTETTSRASGRDGSVAGLSVIGSLIGSLRLWRRRRRESQQLLALPDQTLRDVGLSRIDIIALLAGPTPSRPTEAAPRPCRPAFEARCVARQES